MPSETAITHTPERWTELANDYESLVEPLTRQYAEAALAMAGGIGPGTRVLDVAAGTGALSLLAAAAGAHVLATDLSPGMFARLSQRLASYPDCAVRLMDGQHLEVSDGAFDATFSIFGVILFPDWRQGLSELARATREGGAGCVTVWDDPLHDGPVRFLSEALASTFPDRCFPPPPEGMTVLSSPRALEAEMSAAGFRNVTVRAVSGTWLGPTVDEFVADRERLYSFFQVTSHWRATTGTGSCPRYATQQSDLLLTAASARRRPPRSPSAGVRKPALLPRV